MAFSPDATAAGDTRKICCAEPVQYGEALGLTGAPLSGNDG
jgi:hypothetical protein